MSQNFSRKLRFFALYIVLPLVVAKFLWSLSLFFLAKGSIESREVENYGYHYNLNLASKIVGGVVPIIKHEPVVQSDDGEEIKNIKLKGTYLGGDASFMIIEDGGESNFIYIGESYKGYELVRVSEKKVGLEKNGKNYYILLWDDDNKKSSPTSSQRATSPSIESPVTPGMPANITRDELNSYVKNPNKIWKNIRIQEQRSNGQISGFRVNYVKKHSFFDKAGLKSGDVIKGIDGNEITSLADVMKYYTNIESLDALSLTVERGGEEIELDFNVN
jgi:general secretion pathway protein C